MNRNTKLKDEYGFVALTMVIIVSGILLALIFASSVESGLFFDQAMRKKYRTMNYYYAQSCIDQAFLILSHDYFFTVLEPQSFPDFHCSIISIERNANTITVKALGNYKNATVHREGRASLANHSLEII